MVLAVLLTQTGCAGVNSSAAREAGHDSLIEAHQAGNQATIEQIMASRTWQLPGTIDPVAIGSQASIPVNAAEAKLLGPSARDAARSLALKIYMIEQARHTIDAVYYIFRDDLAGQAVMGALCNAVQRGVDVRLIVDSVGSINPIHADLKTLASCTWQGGKVAGRDGRLSDERARAQVVSFNAISKLNFNRRSHDKLLLIDAQFPERASLITGGRNISLDYYGLKPDGSADPAGYVDLELFLKPEGPDSKLGDVSSAYFTLLFNYDGNRRLYPLLYKSSGDKAPAMDPYTSRRRDYDEALAKLKSFPIISSALAEMPDFTSHGLRPSDVRLAHQLNNLTSSDVVSDVEGNIRSNPNSINYLIDRMATEFSQGTQLKGTLRLVSPYFFIGKYLGSDGEVKYDGARILREFLDEHPGVSVEIITNSLVTTDNFFTQAVIDLDMAPRLLLDPEYLALWQLGDSGRDPTLSAANLNAWQALVSNPQLRIYQTGGLDSNLFGGEREYGKLHAKFIVGQDVGFVGTSNFDYRSMLYNNEVGFFYRSDELKEDLIEIFEALRKQSVRWGSAEWLSMREQLIESDSLRRIPTRHQRLIYRSLTAFDLQYLF